MLLPEEVIVASSHNLGVVSVPATLKLIKDAIIFIQRTQLGPQIFVNLETLILKMFKLRKDVLTVYVSIGFVSM